jgi:tetratricopeptide (TPR) repeat protein
MAARMLGKYAVTRSLKSSDLVEVFEARDSQLDRRVLIKLFHPPVDAGPDFEQRFRSQVKSLAGLRDPHIAQILDFAVADGLPFVVTEYLEGGTLADRLAEYAARHAKMPLAEVDRIVESIAGALDAAHRQGIVHGALSPANILFTAHNQPVLTDFGMAAILGPRSLANPAAVGGAPAYLSPEQAGGKALDARSDEYSLGAVIYELVAGRPPFAGDAVPNVLLQHLTEPVPSPRLLDPGLPQAVADVILRALAKDPGARYGTAHDLARAFGLAVRGEPITLSPETHPRTPPRWLKSLTGAAELVAPLIGRQAPDVHQAARDRRSQVAAILGIVGIALAAFQFLAGALDLVNLLFSQSMARVIGYLPYVIVVMLVGGGGLLLYLALSGRTTMSRRRAGGLFAVTLAVGLAWGGWTIYNQERPPDSILIAVGDFDREGSVQIDFGHHIYEQLKSEIGDTGGKVTLERTHEVYADAASARAAGARLKATIVIWGWYDDSGVRPQVELLRLPSLNAPVTALGLLVPAANAASSSSPVPDITLKDVASFVHTPVNMDDFQVVVDSGKNEVDNATTLLLGVIFFANGDTQQALAYYDKALAASTAGASSGDGKIVGQEVIYFERATALYQENRLPEAIADLRQAIAAKSDMYEAHHNLAILYSATCDPVLELDKALAEAKTAVELRPDSVEAHELLGTLYQQAERYGDAVAELQAATGLAPQDARAQQLLSGAYSNAGQSDLAQQAGERALALLQAQGGGPGASNRDPAAKYLDLGDAYMAAGNMSAALGQYQAAQKAAPSDPRVYRGLGNVYYWLGQLQQAAQAYQEWVAVAPNDDSAHLLLGILYQEQKDSARALPELEKAASLATCDNVNHVVLAGAYYASGDYGRAIAEFQSASRIDPQDPEAFYMLGALQWLQAEGNGSPGGAPAPNTAGLQDAVASLTAATTISPTMPEAWFALGSAYSALGEDDKAAAAWATAAGERPEDPGYLASAGDGYDKVGRLDEAVAAYKASLALQEDSKIRVSLGWVYQQQKNLDAAAAEYQRAAADDPTNSLAYRSLAIVYEQQGKLAQAAGAYEKLLAQKEDPGLRLAVASIYASLGKADAAIAAYEKVVDEDRQNMRALTALGYLYASENKLDLAATRFRQALAAPAATVTPTLAMTPTMPITPALVAAHAGLATVEYKICDLSQATNDAESAAILGGASTYTATLASMYEAQGRRSEASQIYTRLRAQPAGDALAHILDADFLMRSAGQLTRTASLDDAAQELELVLQAPGEAPVIASVAHLTLGQVYYREHKDIAAQGEFTAALQAFPANAEAQTWLGSLALRGGDPAAALSAYDAAKELLPAYGQQLDNDDAHLLAVGLQYARGIALERQGQSSSAGAAYDQAVTVAQALVQATPRWPQAHFALASAYLARGDASQAAAEYGVATQCNQALAAQQQWFAADLAELRGKP